MISLIVPTYNNAEGLQDILISIEKQSYPYKEIIVVDDNSQIKANDKGATRLVVEEAKKQFRTNLVYLNTYCPEYGLAKARNMGVIESMGDVLFFLDDRYTLESNTLDIVSRVREGVWQYGIKIIKGKESIKKSFIENVSWISKNTFRKFGGFNERFNMYGAMSQDVRERCSAIGITTEQIEKVKVKEISRSRSASKKDQIWKSKLLLWKLNN